MRRSVAFGFLVLLLSPFSLQAQAADSTNANRRPPVITWMDAAVLGAGLVGSVALMNSDEGIARELQSDRWQGSHRLHDVADVAAVVNEKSLFALGLVTYGVSRLVGAPRTTTDIAWHTTESIFIASATATVVRGLLGRSRPFVSSGFDAYDYNPGKGFTELRYRAYPSIHAASAFATASALTAETARHSRRAAFIVGPIAYSLASLPGLARMYGDKHWASDVLMGAALGTVSGWASVRYHHHRPNNWLDRVFIGPVPTVSGGTQVGLVAGFKF